MKNFLVYKKNRIKVIDITEEYGFNTLAWVVFLVWFLLRSVFQSFIENTGDKGSCYILADVYGSGFISHTFDNFFPLAIYIIW